MLLFVPIPDSLLLCGVRCGEQQKEGAPLLVKPWTTRFLMHLDPRTCIKMRIVPDFSAPICSPFPHSACSRPRTRMRPRRKPRTTRILMHWRGRLCSEMRIVPDLGDAPDPDRIRQPDISQVQHGSCRTFVPNRRFRAWTKMRPKRSLPFGHILVRF